MLGDLGAVYREHSRSVLVFLTRRTFDAELAMDLTAETFAQALLSRRRFHGTSVDEERAWLFGIAAHMLSRSLRRSRTEDRAMRRLGLERPGIDRDEIDAVLELAGLADLRGAVQAGLQTLSEEHREAVRLRVVEELSYEEVARRLQVSEPAARARVSRGLRALAETLQPFHAHTEPT